MSTLENPCPSGDPLQFTTLGTASCSAFANTHLLQAIANTELLLTQHNSTLRYQFHVYWQCNNRCQVCCGIFHPLMTHNSSIPNLCQRQSLSHLIFLIEMAYHVSFKECCLLFSAEASKNYQLITL